MKKQISDILYNPSSMQTCHSESQVTYIGLGDRDTEVLKAFEQLVVAPFEPEIEASLSRLQQEMMAGVSGGTGLILLKEFNLFLERTSKRFGGSQALFEASLQTVLVFKSVVDKQTPSEVSISQDEWIQLERALYTLAIWEEGLADTSSFKGVVLQ